MSTKEKTVDEQEVKELYFEYKMASEQLKKVEAYAKETTESLEQIANTINALEQFAQQEKGARLFAPIANGIFIDVTLNDPKSFRMNVGKGVVVTKSLNEAKALLGRQREELERLRRRAEHDMVKLSARLKEIEALVE